MGLTVREHLVLAHRARARPTALWRDMFDPALALAAGHRRERAGRRAPRAPALTRVAKAPVAALPLGIGPPGRGGPGPGQRPARPPPGRAPLRTGHQGVGEPASVFRQIVAIRASGDLSLIIVEHDVAAVLALSDTVFVLDFGERIAAGTPSRSATTRPCGPPTWATATATCNVARAVPPRRRRRGSWWSDRAPPRCAGTSTVRYGPSQALFGVSLEVPPGTGAGRAGRQRRRQEHAGSSRLAGLVPPAAGRICFDGQDITGRRPTASAGWA